MAQHCALRFLDGFCNEECNVESCYFDGYECDKEKVKNSSKDSCDGAKGHYCLANYGNGFCDKGCDTEACGWDGGDCYEPSIEQTFTPEDLDIWVAIPAHNYPLVAKLLREISEKTRTTVRLKVDENNHRMIQPIHGTNLTKLSLIADPRNCKENCLTRVTGVADFLSAAQNTGKDSDSLLNTVQGVYSNRRPMEIDSLDGRRYFFLVVIGICLITGLVMVSLKTPNGTRRIRAPCWKPPDFRPVHRTRTRDNLSNNQENQNISTYQAASGEYGRRSHLSLKSSRNLYGRLPSVDSQEMEAFVEVHI